MAADKRVVIGRISSPYGVRGWVKVISFTENVEDILSYPTWLLPHGKDDRPVALEAGKRHGKGVVVKLEGFDTPEAVRVLAGLPVSVERAALPETRPNEYYWTDLEGLTVIDQKGTCLGTVAWMIETGSTDCMVVQDGDGNQTAIPWMPGTVVTRVSLETREIFVDWDPI